MRYGKWCPNGCGKCVVIILIGNTKNPKKFECMRCKEFFTKTELVKFNKI